jgi:putative ABC transport system permease protein
MFGRRSARDFRAEIDAHIRLEADRLKALGANEAEALAAARRRFGNITRAEEDFAEARRWRWPVQLRQDLRLGVRLLRRDALVSGLAVITLAVGLAVNASMFSLVNAFVLRRPPAVEANRILVVSTVDPAGGFLPDVTPVSAPTFLAWRYAIAGVTTTAAFGSRTVNVTVDGATAEYHADAATAEFFGVLGVTPALGRTFAADEDQPGRAGVAVLSDDLWRRQFGGDPAVVGRDIRIDRQTVRIVGVLRPDFKLLGYSADLWVPLTLDHQDAAPASRSHRWLTMIGRLGPNATEAAARASLTGLAAQAETDFPASEKGWRVAVRTLPDFLAYSFHASDALLVMSTAASLILLLGCANVAGLLIARSVGREREIAIRRSLGASPWRIVQQLLTESVILATAGGAAGWVLTTVGVRFLSERLAANPEIAAVGIGLDWRVLAFSVALTAVAAMASGLAPALQAARDDPRRGLTGTSRGASASRRQSRLRLAIVTGEIAIALTLLIGSGLLVRALYVIAGQQLGFDPHPLLTAKITLDRAEYARDDEVAAFTRAFLARATALPGATAVAVASNLPSTGASSVRFRVDSGESSPAEITHAAADLVVSPSFFAAVGIPLRQGRLLTEADLPASTRVVVVNEAFARRYLGGRSALGSRLTLRVDGQPVPAEIIGVVGDMKRHAEDGAIDPAVFEAVSQRPLRSMAVIVRASGSPGSVAPGLRSALKAIDGDLALSQVLTMDDVLDRLGAADTLFMWVLAVFAGFAFLLAGIGIYGLVAFSVGQRQREIGIRLALGASRPAVLRAVLWPIGVAGTVGILAGLAMAVPLPAAFDAMFVGLVLHEARLYVEVPILLVALTAVATLVPARRALRVNPVETLRLD